MNSVSEQKTHLRAQLLARRKALSGAHHGESLKAQFLSLHVFAKFGTVAAYWPMAGEIDIRPLIGALEERGQACALPVVVQKNAPLLFRRWSLNDRLVEGPHATRQPQDNMPEVIPDLILVPLLGFDLHGGRLGFGGGYYDRTLAALTSPLCVGVAFDEQQVDEVPMDDFDQRMDWIVTPSRVIEIKK